MEYEIVLYGTLAVIVCVVFYSVLGRQIGRGPDEDTGPEDLFGTTRDMDSRPKPVTAAAPLVLASAADATPLEQITGYDPDFTPDRFLDQATTAYSMVLEAFASGDRDTLAMLLTPRMHKIYADAIDARERQELKQVTDILRIGDADILKTVLDGSDARIDVSFSSELSSALLDEAGQTVQGDPDLVARVNEVWTFERNLKSDNPAWLLTDVAPETDQATGDEMPVDPAPDTKF